MSGSAKPIFVKKKLTPTVAAVIVSPYYNDTRKSEEQTDRWPGKLDHILSQDDKNEPPLSN